MTLHGPNEPAGEPTHICCCDPATALCGADVAGQSIKAVPPHRLKNACPRCVALDNLGVRCADPKCPGPNPDGVPAP